MYESNEVLEKLPRHLMNLVIEQPYNGYTAQDHALWRYVMRQNVRYLSKVAHGSYLEGLKRTGISIENIPHMYGMNRILKEIGWAAVAVDGFIPPSAFMEFQAYNVLVIAADIRPIDQIEYTPAPDIIHEAAGHAPIIADEEYAEYLRLFGEIGHKAISSPNDYKLYEAIRHLSILKADPYSSTQTIAEAEKELDAIERSMNGISEMAQIRNLHWWTVEYGLIGNVKEHKIYGAGLLSSIGESYSCLQPAVRKLPYNIDAKDVLFDITTRQPQLFVTPDFQYLTKVLLEYKNTMAMNRGGLDGMVKALNSQNAATYVYSSGLQVSGTLQNLISIKEKLIYASTKGPTILCTDNKVLEGHGKNYHSEGFSSPIGKLKACPQPLELMSEDNLKAKGIFMDKESRLEFESGVVVRGVLKRITRNEGKNILFSFDNCMVTYEDQVLFQPSWGTYDMAVGEKIISVFSGPADPVAFELDYSAPTEKTHKIEHTLKASTLHDYFQQVRNMRENNVIDKDLLENIWNSLKTDYTDDWLLNLEILEVLMQHNSVGKMRDGIEYHLQNMKRNPAYINLITNGLELIYH